MDFDTARQKKFEQGRREHGQPWDAAHIDARREMQGECLDLFNYSLLLTDKELAERVQSVARALWHELV